jgi:photosystem II stability/assembly factor-like uncharacterized protein
MSAHSAHRYFWILPLLIIFSLFYTIQTRAGNDVWTSIGLYGASIEALAIDPQDDQVVFAGANNAGLYKTADGGETWTEISPLNFQKKEFDDIAIDPNNGNNIYVSLHQGPLYKSSDGGQSWRQIHDEKSYAVAVHPTDSNILLLGGWDGGIWRSTDAGETWQPAVGAPQAFIGARQISFSLGAPHIVYAAGFAGVWKSLDAGRTWKAINNGFAGAPELWSVAIDPYTSQVVYIGSSNDGIYKTTNGGDSWRPIGTGLGSSHITSIVINPGNQQLLYVGGGINPGTGMPGVYQSLDNQGSNWAPMMDGMGSRAIYRLAISTTNPRSLYAGTLGGIWKYTLMSTQKDYSLSINDGDLFTNQTTVTLKFTAPSGTSEMIISNDGGFANASWEAYKPEKVWSITEYGDAILPRIVYAKFKTNGIVTGLYQDDIILDTVAPTGSVSIAQTGLNQISLSLSQDTLKLSLNSHQLFLPSVLLDFLPGHERVRLILSANDDLSGVRNMQISNAPEFSKANWESYITLKDWYLPDVNGASVYVRFRDQAGNISPTYSASK